MKKGRGFPWGRRRGFSNKIITMYLSSGRSDKVPGLGTSLTVFPSPGLEAGVGGCEPVRPLPGVAVLSYCPHGAEGEGALGPLS